MDGEVHDGIGRTCGATRVPDARIAADLESGAWHARNAELREQDSFDGGCRRLVAGRAASVL